MPHSRQAEADALGVTTDDLEELDQYREDERLWRLTGIEIWEIRMRREGASEEAIEVRRKELRLKMEQAIGC